MGSPSSQTSTVTLGRVQSPSSINTYKQCPRKYYYRYIAGLPSRPSIHLIRGKVVHTALEKFFDADVTNIPEKNFFFTLKVVLNERFKEAWRAAANDFAELELSEERLQGYYDETKQMINNYFSYFLEKSNYFLRFMRPHEAWAAVKPQREMHFESKLHRVHGYIDAIHDEAGKTLILDYKTSRRSVLTEEYKLQLSIYAMMYQEQYHTPDLVGIYFLRDGKEVLLDVTQELIDAARSEVEAVHIATQTNEENDYPMRPGPLCKWATGQCDFYEYCFLGKKAEKREPEKELFIELSE
ncbi:PD-(D/E)XK nuclease family protein [Candidatus Woesearchaeota archaeon]|nr:MAG: PD-(D/E)XK nuclease family protein [Candidatus Woesearchaeota archaeon]